MTLSFSQNLYYIFVKFKDYLNIILKFKENGGLDIGCKKKDKHKY